MCLVYLDDIFIFSKSVKEHIGNVDNIPKRLQEVDVTLKIKKCKFFTHTVKYLGHIISSKNARFIKLISRQSNMLSSYKKSNCTAFLDSATSSDDLSASFAHKARSMHILLQENTPEDVTFNEKLTKAVRDLLDTILSSPGLALLQLRL